MLAHPKVMPQTPGSTCLSLQRDARAIFQGALRGCDVERALTKKLHTGSTDETGEHMATVCMDGVRRLLVLAMGKGAGAMLRAVLSREDLAGARDVAGILVAPERPAWLPSTMEYIRGGHPMPDANSRAAAERMQRLLRDDPRDGATLCLFLVSGGSSAMVELPLDQDISLADTAAFHRALVHSAASIVEINAVRKHFSAVKGGRLAMAARSLRSLTLLMSDVPAGHLDALGSGPTLPDRSTVADCREILQRHALLPVLPAAVLDFFAREDLPETPKPDQVPSHALLLLSQADLALHAAEAARSRGYTPVLDDTPDDWPAAEAAQYLLDRFRNLRSTHGRVCLISTGEVVVKVPAALQGVACGGRNHHFVLEAATRLAAGDGDLAILSCGSDGIDGNTGDAGAVIASADFRATGFLPQVHDALQRFEAQPLLRRMGCSVHTGPTGLNLRDLRLLLG